MSKHASPLHPLRFGEEALAASRQVWLASLGAAAITRDWVQGEAGRTFRTLVRQGTVVESRAVAFVGDQIEGSMSRANHLWQRTRLTVRGTVRQAADAAIAVATQALPKSLPRIEIPVGLWRGAVKKRAAPVAAARKTARKPAAKRTTAAKRAVAPAAARKRRVAVA